MRFAKLTGSVLLLVALSGCGQGTFFAADRPTPGGQSSNAQGGRRGFGFGIATVQQELDSRGVQCGPPQHTRHEGPVLYRKICR